MPDANQPALTVKSTSTQPYPHACKAMFGRAKTAADAVGAAAREGRPRAAHDDEDCVEGVAFASTAAAATTSVSAGGSTFIGVLLGVDGGSTGSCASLGARVVRSFDPTWALGAPVWANASTLMALAWCWHRAVGHCGQRTDQHMSARGDEAWSIAMVSLMEPAAVLHGSPAHGEDVQRVAHDARAA